MKCVLTIPRDRDPAARELLDDHRVGRQIQPHPAVLLGDGHAEQPQLAHLRHDRLRELVGGVVVLRLRDDLLVDELADHLQDRLLLVGLLEEPSGHRAILHPLNFTRDARQKRAARAPERWSSCARDGSRREWTFGELADAAERLAGAAPRARRRARRRRPHAGRKPPGMGDHDARVLPPGLRRAARAPSSCARRISRSGSPSRSRGWSSPTPATRRRCCEGWSGDDALGPAR